MADTIAHDVECGTCFAEPGEDCLIIDGSGVRRDPEIVHLIRSMAARAAAQKETP